MDYIYLGRDRSVEGSRESGNETLGSITFWETL
jgi:hypothetical protein